MCGIVGVMRGSMTEGMVDMFEQLLYADVFRGPHATGVYRANADGQTSLFKEAIPASMYLSRKGWDDLRGNLNGTAGYQKLAQVYVGHNRYATVGASGESKNAHPFKEGNITMVHNGTVAKYRLNEHMKYDVDSHAVCAMLNSHGLEDTLKVLDGKFTLVWHDASDNTMNFIRNAERPLHMVEFTDGGWAFASEGEMLTWINGRRKSPFGIKRAFELPVGYHHKFSLANSKVELVEVVKYDLPKFFQSSYYSGTRSTVTSGASAASNHEGVDARKMRLLKEWGIDTGKTELKDLIFALDNIAFTPYSGTQTNGRIDADAWGYDDAIDEAETQSLTVDCIRGGKSEDVQIVVYGVSMTDWKNKHSQSDWLFGKVDSVYETTMAGRTKLTITLVPSSLCGELADGVDAINSDFFPLRIKEEEVVTSTDADKSVSSTDGGNSGTGVSGTTTDLVVVVDNTVGKNQAASVKSDKLFNLSGVPYSLKDLKEDKLSCSWCGNSIHQHNYEMSDMFFRSHICETCAKDLNNGY